MSINIIDAFVYMRNYIIHNASASKEIENLKERIERLESANEDTLKAVNDLSEDSRKELDSIYIALSELSIKQEKTDNPTPRKIITGFKSYNKETE
jgi:esterase/lipase